MHDPLETLYYVLYAFKRTDKHKSKTVGFLISPALLVADTSRLCLTFTLDSCGFWSTLVIILAADCFSLDVDKISLLRAAEDYQGTLRFQESEKSQWACLERQRLNSNIMRRIRMIGSRPLLHPRHGSWHSLSTSSTSNFKLGDIMAISQWGYPTECPEQKLLSIEAHRSLLWASNTFETWLVVDPE
jgi:hypothetical protein